MAASGFGSKHRDWKPEFQAVILAGYGTSLQPLTNELSSGGGASTPTPKALLPIGNLPMIFHPIQWLQSAGIVDIFIVCPSSHKPLIHEAIWKTDESSHPFSHLSIMLETIDDSEAASLDTADILRKFSSRFVTDLIILPCDFVAPPKLKLSAFLNDYRVDMERPLLKALLYERGEAVKDGPEIKLYGINKDTNALVWVDPEDDEEDELELSMTLLMKYPNIQLTRRYLDSHVYIVRHAVLELLAERPALESFKSDFVPWVCKLPYRKSHRRKYLESIRIPEGPQSEALLFSSQPYTPSSVSQNRYAHIPNASSNSSSLLRPGLGLGMNLANLNSPSIAYSVIADSDVFKSPMPSEFRALSDEGSPPTGTGAGTGKYLSLPGAVTVGGGGVEVGGEKEKKEEKDGHEDGAVGYDPVDPKLLRCAVALHRLKDGYAGRANTIGGYFELNRQALSASAALTPAHIPSSTSSSAQISSDSLIAPSSRIGDRSSIKKSVVGAHCMIGKNVRMSGCVVMDYVEIKDGAKLDNSVLSRSTLIGEGATLKDCELAPGVTVQDKASIKGERLSQW